MFAAGIRVLNIRCQWGDHTELFNRHGAVTLGVSVGIGVIFGFYLLAAR